MQTTVVRDREFQTGIVRGKKEEKWEMHENSGIEAQRAEVRTRSLRIEIGTSHEGKVLGEGGNKPQPPLPTREEVWTNIVDTVKKYLFIDICYGYKRFWGEASTEIEFGALLFWP